MSKFKELFDEVINESKFKDIEEFGNKISKLTQANNHTQAYLEVAKYLKHKKFIKIFEGIKMIHDADGYVNSYLDKLRYAKYEELMKYGESKIGNDFTKYIYSNL